MLAVGSIDGGVHPQLALFLASEVMPVQHRPGDFSTVEDAGLRGLDKTDGLVIVGHGPNSTAVRLTNGFRVILFTNCPHFSTVSLPSVHSTSGAPPGSTPPTVVSPLVFLQDFPSALARMQLIRFGGLDSIGNEASRVQLNDNPPSSSVPKDATRSETSDEEDGNSSNSSKHSDDVPIPRLVLACLGLCRTMGFESSMTLDARLQEDIAHSFPSVVGGTQAEKSAAALSKAQREALWYSEHLSATHEAVVALLSAGPPCFDPTIKTTADIAIPSGGQPTSGVSDDVEGDQNRVLNNLIETVFAYKSMLENALDAMSTCDRASQSEKAKTVHLNGCVPNRLASCTVGVLMRVCEMFHARGLDPALYSPALPGVRDLFHGVVRKAAEYKDGQELDEGGVGRCILGSLSQALVTRVARNCTWVVPMAVMAATTPDGFPACGWWDACAVLVADRYGLERTASGQMTLERLTDMLASKTVIASRAESSRNVEASPHVDVEVSPVDMRAVEQGISQIRAIVNPWRDHGADTEDTVRDHIDVAGNGSDSDDGDQQTRDRAALSPQKWDLGFDHSALIRGRAFVSAIARTRAPTPRRVTNIENVPNAQGRETTIDEDTFLLHLSYLWRMAREDRSKLNRVQADAAEIFCQDEVLRRLVLLEATMKYLFAMLPRYVLCEPRLWAGWVDCVRSTVSSVHKHVEGSTERLNSLLSNPPPRFGSSACMGGPGRATDRGDTSSSNSSSSVSSSDESGEDVSGTGVGENDGFHGTAESPFGSSGPDARSKEEPVSRAFDITPVDSIVGAPRVRRDSRERIKVKLGHIGGQQEEGLGQSVSPNADFAARATRLFGVSSRPTRAEIVGVSAIPKPSDEEKGRVGIATPAATPATLDRDTDVDNSEEDAYITFVAESFRPRRDNSEWHKEVISDPPPQRIVKKDAIPRPPVAVVPATVVIAEEPIREKNALSPSAAPLEQSPIADHLREIVSPPAERRNIKKECRQQSKETKSRREKTEVHEAHIATVFSTKKTSCPVRYLLYFLLRRTQAHVCSKTIAKIIVTPWTRVCPRTCFAKHVRQFVGSPMYSGCGTQQTMSCWGADILLSLLLLCGAGQSKVSSEHWMRGYVRSHCQRCEMTAKTATQYLISRVYHTTLSLQVRYEKMIVRAMKSNEG